MMVSKKPIQNKKFLEFDAYVEQHGGLYGEVDGVQIVCAHLATELPLEYAGDYETYQGHNLYELTKIFEFFDTKANGSPQVLMGDFNIGPVIPELDIIGEYPEHFTIILNEGWKNANTD